MGSVRVLTVNVLGRGGVWADRRSVLISGLRELLPDVVAFQDVIKTGEYDQVSDLLGTSYYVAHQSVRAPDGSGVSIASGWPLGDIHELDLRLTDRSSDFPCGALIAEVLAPKPVGSLLLVNKRTSWQHSYESERELEAVAAARFVEELVEQHHRHVVVASDLNATPNAASVRFWHGRQSLDGMSVCYRDAWESTHLGEAGHTFTPRNPLVSAGEMPLDRGRRIDYILVRCGEMDQRWTLRPARWPSTNQLPASGGVIILVSSRISSCRLRLTRFVPTRSDGKGHDCQGRDPQSARWRSARGTLHAAVASVRAAGVSLRRRCTLV